MSKISHDQKIAKLEDAIAKEELIIEESKAKIKKYKAELKTVKAEKEQTFDNELLKLMKSKGLSQADLMSTLNQLNANNSTAETENVSSPDVNSASQNL